MIKTLFPFVEKSVCGCNFGPSVGSAPATNGFPVDFGGVSDVKVISILSMRDFLPRFLVVVCCGVGDVVGGAVLTASDDWFGGNIGDDVGGNDGAVVGTLVGTV